MEGWRGTDSRGMKAYILNPMGQLRRTIVIIVETPRENEI